MNRVFSLLDDTEILFDEHTAPEYAVVYAYVTEDAPQLASAFFHAVHSNTLGEFYTQVPLIIGAKSVGCGNWGTLK